MSTPQPIGPILDGLGVTINLDHGELCESALVILKIVNGDGDVLVGLYAGDMNWLDKLALIEAARQRMHHGACTSSDGD